MSVLLNNINTVDAGCLFVVAAPSGGGKTSLIAQLINTLDNIKVSISYTTRPRRPLEVDGNDYFFVNEQVFQQMIQQDDFVEYARVFDHYYGTSLRQINTSLRSGTDVVLAIDWQGARQIKQKFIASVGVFILPPSLDILKQRLQQRRQDDEDIIKVRMNQAQHELSHYHEFDYLIVNDDFMTAANELVAIVITRRIALATQLIKQRQLLACLLP